MHEMKCLLCDELAAWNGTHWQHIDESLDDLHEAYVGWTPPDDADA